MKKALTCILAISTLILICSASARVLNWGRTPLSKRRGETTHRAYLEHIKAVCPGCKADANQYNKLADTYNLTLRQLEHRIYQRNNLHETLRDDFAVHDQFIKDHGKAALSNTATGRKIAKNIKTKQALYKKYNLDMRALKKKLGELHPKILEAFAAFDHCQKRGCSPEYNIISSIAPINENICRHKLCRAYIKDYNDRAKRLAKLEHQLHALQRQQRALGKKATLAQRGAIAKKIVEIRAKINENLDGFRGETGLRKIIMACLRVKCGKKLLLPEVPADHQVSPGYDNQPVSMGGQMGVGAGANAGISEQNATVEHNGETENSSATMSGIGFTAFAQYYFASHPQWFLFGSYEYPGDHKVTPVLRRVAGIQTHLNLTKRYLFTLAIARQIISAAHGSLALGLGVGALGERLRVTAEDPAGTVSSNRNRTAIVPTAFAELLIPIMHHISIATLFTFTYMPSIALNVVGPSNIPFHMRMKGALEASVTMGLKYNFAM